MPRPPTGIVPEQLGHILHHNQIHGYAAFQDTPNDFLYDQRFASGRPWIDVTASPFGSTNGNTACQNCRNAATAAKNAGILVVTIAFRISGVRCDGSTSGTAPKVNDVLASVASNHPNGSPSVSQTPCITASDAATENADGDHFFCTSGTPSAADLASIYQTAAGQVGTGVKLVRLP